MSEWNDGAEAFKNMMLDASSPVIKPHIEGVFEVFRIQQFREHGEWVSIDDMLPPEKKLLFLFTECGFSAGRYNPLGKHGKWSLYFGCGRVTHWMIPVSPTAQGDV